GLGVAAEVFWLHGAVLLLLGSIAGLGTALFVLDACRDKLLQLVWFRLLYESLIALRDWAHGMVDPIMHKIRRLIWLSRPQRAGRFFRRIVRIRRYVRRAEPAPSSPRDPGALARAVQ